MTTHLPLCNCDHCLLALMQATSTAERQQGWEAWYQRDSPFLQAFIERRCRATCPDLAEDILHDTFIIGFRNVSSGRYATQGVALCAYLVGIAKHLVAGAIRLQRREGAGSGNMEEEIFAGPDPDDKIYLEELCSLIREAHTHQSTLHQRVVEALYCEGRSSEEVALEVGKTAANTRLIAHRTVTDMAKYLKHEHNIRMTSRAIRTVIEAL